MNSSSNQHPVLKKTHCEACKHLITPEEVDANFKIMHSTKGEHYVFRYVCALCGAEGQKAVEARQYMETADSKATRKDISKRIIRDAFLSENRGSQQQLFDENFRGNPITVVEVVEFCGYLETDDSALRDLAEEFEHLEIEEDQTGDE